MTEKKNLFTLIHGDAVRAAPGVKVLPSSAYSELLRAEELVEKAKEDAELYRKEVEKECEELKEQAKREGFEEGLKQWAEQIGLLKQERESAHDEVVKLAAPLALQAAKKLIGRELEQSDKAIIDIVKSHLKAISHHRKIKIFVGKQDYKVLEEEKERLKQLFETLESLSIVEREEVQPGGCIIETEAGIINAQLENQWKILERAFEAFLASEEEAK